MTSHSKLHRASFLGLVLWLLAGLAIAPLQAAPPNYLPAGQPDAVALLAPPPLPGSAEQAADMASVIAVHRNCSEADAALAKSEKKFFIFSFTPAIGPFFVAGKLPKTEALFEHLRKDAESVLDAGKEHWKRPRPYTVEPSLANGEPENSYSYPSGHSTRATLYALVLAELFPDKSEEILAIGRGIGWRRVEIARHYPTDIYAGRVLAQAIVRELKANPAFVRDLAEVKEELAGARSVSPAR